MSCQINALVCVKYFYPSREPATKADEPETPAGVSLSTQTRPQRTVLHRATATATPHLVPPHETHTTEPQQATTTPDRPPQLSEHTALPTPDERPIPVEASIMAHHDCEPPHTPSQRRPTSGHQTTKSPKPRSKRRSSSARIVARTSCSATAHTPAYQPNNRPMRKQRRNADHRIEASPFPDDDPVLIRDHRR